VTARSAKKIIISGHYNLFMTSSRIKEAADSLANAKQLLQEAERLAGIGHWVVYPDTRELYWSDEIYRIHGLEVGGEIDIEAAINAYHPDDRTKVTEYVRRAIEEKENYDFELRLIRADGEVRYVHSTGIVRLKPNGDVDSLFGIFRDITEQKRHEEELRQARDNLEIKVKERTLELTAEMTERKEVQEELARVFDLSPDMIGSGNLDGYFTKVNYSFERLLGYGKEEFCEKPFLEFVHKDDLDVTTKALIDSATGKQKDPFTIANRYRCKDGTYRAIEWRVQAIVEDNKFYAVGRDITERRILEEQLRRTHKMDAVGQLTSGIAHDFNNILAIIKGNLGLMKRLAAEDELLSQWIDEALTGTDRGVALTKSLLQFSREDVRETKIISINELIREKDDLIRKSLTSAINIKHDLAEDLWLTEINAGDFFDAFINMAINSRDAMPQGGSLIIKTRNAHLNSNYGIPQDEYVLLEITDTGTGIKAKMLSRVFDPFFSTKERGKGTGLGLSMVFGFVKRSGGDITISSEYGHGTTIKIYLPRAKSVSTNELVTDNISSEVSSGNETILVVDDEVSLLKITAYQLQELGYKTLTANSGDEALKLLVANSGIDLLFSDVVMPGGVNGIMLANKALEINPGLKVLLTSGLADQEAFSKLGSDIDAEMVQRLSSELLPKPYSEEDLAYNVRRILDTKNE